MNISIRYELLWLWKCTVYTAAALSSGSGRSTAPTFIFTAPLLISAKNNSWWRPRWAECQRGEREDQQRGKRSVIYGKDDFDRCDDTVRK